MDKDNIWKLKYEKYKLKYLKLRDSMHGGVGLTDTDKEYYRGLFQNATVVEIDDYHHGFHYAYHTEFKSESDYTYKYVIDSKEPSVIIGHPEITKDKYKKGIEDGIAYKRRIINEKLSPDEVNAYRSSLIDFLKKLKAEKMETEKISDSKSFSIISYNVYNSLDSSKPFSIMDIIEGLNPTYIFLQEATTKDTPTEYTLQVYPEAEVDPDNGHKIMEKVGLLFKGHGPKKEIETVESIVFSKEKRYGFIIVHNGIRIANIHLAGGRKLDMYLKFSIVTNDSSLFDKIINYRLNLLEKIIALKPDIIVGDFNTVLSNFDVDSFIEYLKKIDLKGLDKSDCDKMLDDNKSKVVEYNDSVLNFLTKSEYKYTYGQPGNIDSRGTNMRGNTVVDGVWYKGDLKLNESEVIYNDRFNSKDGITYPVSDHYPVYAKFTVK